MAETPNTQPEAPRKRRFKTLGIIAAVVTGPILLAIGIVFWATSGVVDAVDSFQAKIHDKDLRGAYAVTSTGFKDATDFAAFKSFVEAHKLGRYESGSWSSRATQGYGNGATGRLEGSLVAADGTAKPVKVDLVKEGGKWRVHGLDLEQPGANAQSHEPEKSLAPPPKPKFIVLVHASDIAFAQAVAAKKMDGFHTHIARTWAKQHSPAQLEGFFAAFIENEIDLLPIKTATPVLDGEPTTDKDGVMTVKARYDTRQLVVFVQHKYMREGTEWKLVGYKMETRPREEMKSLASDLKNHVDNSIR